MNIFLSPYVPESLVSRDGFSRPVPRQPAHLHIQAESGAYSRIPPDFRGGVYLFIKIVIRHRSGPSRVYLVTQLRTDGVHCQEFAGTTRRPPVVLRVYNSSSNGCASILQVTMDQLITLMYACIFPRAQLVRHSEVVILIVR